jgi:D-alanyl-lipoteichoic acid acyltransferase DltB (MBOAT superfamily)
MTLGGWLRNYIFYPFQKSKQMGRIRAMADAAGGKRAGAEASKYLSLLVLWFSIGFWHGGTWKYIFGAGLFFFAMISLGLALNPLSKKAKKLLRVKPGNIPFRVFQSLRTFALFSFCISFCRMGSFKTGLSYWKSAFSGIASQRLFSPELLEAITLKELFVVIAGLSIMLTVSVFQLNSDIKESFEKRASLRWAAVFSLAFATIIFGFYGIGYNARDFIYGSF